MSKYSPLTKCAWVEHALNVILAAILTDRFAKNSIISWDKLMRESCPG
jgi:hypothetical protein